MGDMANPKATSDVASVGRVLAEPGRHAAPLASWSGAVPEHLLQGASNTAGREADTSQSARIKAPVQWERMICVSTRVLDVLIIVATSMIFIHAWAAGEDVKLDRYYLVTALCAVLLSNSLQLLGAYQFRALMDFRCQAGRFLLTWALWNAVFLGCAALTQSVSEFSSAWFVAWSGSVAGLFIFSRLIIRHALLLMWEQGTFLRNVVIVGAGPQGRELAKGLLSPEYGVDIRLLGFFDDRLSRTPPMVQAVPLLGSVAQLVTYARQHRVDLIIIALPLAAEERIVGIVEMLKVLPIDIHLSPDLVVLRRGNWHTSNFGPLALVEASSCPIKDWRFVAKVIEDKLLATSLVIAFAPLMLLIAFLVKQTSRGPVLFKQKRYGFNNQLITVFKFRTMYIDASDQLADKLVTKNDPRVTPIGALLRKTSLDELPQLFNVLSGEMSLVGPRPHAINAKAADCLYEKAVRTYAFRHRVKPGMTGWAQVNGWRGETDTIEKIEQRVAHDLYYIENWTLWLDLKILAMTLRAVLSRKGAH